MICSWNKQAIKWYWTDLACSEIPQCSRCAVVFTKEILYMINEACEDIRSTNKKQDYLVLTIQPCDLGQKDN